MSSAYKVSDVYQIRNHEHHSSPRREKSYSKKDRKRNQKRAWIREMIHANEIIKRNKQRLQNLQPRSEHSCPMHNYHVQQPQMVPKNYQHYGSVGQDFYGASGVPGNPVENPKELVIDLNNARDVEKLFNQLKQLRNRYKNSGRLGMTGAGSSYDEEASNETDNVDDEDNNTQDENKKASIAAVWTRMVRNRQLREYMNLLVLAGLGVVCVFAIDSIARSNRVIAELKREIDVKEEVSRRMANNVKNGSDMKPITEYF